MGIEPNTAEISSNVGSRNENDLFKQLRARNKGYVENFSSGELTSPARQEIAIVTCMDSRVNPIDIFQFQLGDIKVIRNAGGRVTDDVLRSLILATHFLAVKDVLVMHHTDCALAFKSEDDVLKGLPVQIQESTTKQQFLAMPYPDLALRADVKAVASCKLIPETVSAYGILYDVRTGLFARVI